MASGPSLAGRHIAVPETRALDILCEMLEKRGATALRCPMVRVRDAEDETAILGWIQRLIDDPFEDLIIYTGEGLGRLQEFAERAGLESAFISAIAACRVITRGPKPVRVLRLMGLEPDIRAAAPTTDGLVDTLQGLDMKGRRVGLQLYPAPKVQPLLDLLGSNECTVDHVTPYRYVPTQDAKEVSILAQSLADGEADLIAFTSMAQVNYLYEAAKAQGVGDLLQQGLRRTPVAVVGPVAETALRERGIDPAISADEPFAMKALVRAIEAQVLGAD